MSSATVVISTLRVKVFATHNDSVSLHRPCMSEKPMSGAIHVLTVKDRTHCCIAQRNDTMIAIRVSSQQVSPDDSQTVTSMTLPGPK